LLTVVLKKTSFVACAIKDSDAHRSEPIGINCQAKDRVNKPVAKTVEEATRAWLRVP
jgi:hypothetical protein